MATVPQPATAYAHIVATPGTMGGQPRIDGRRIRVSDIVAARDFGGHTPEDIVVSVYPSLTLAEVYSALAYYEDHRAEMELAAIREVETVRLFREQHPNLVNKRFSRD